jgi:hypothetical protein
VTYLAVSLPHFPCCTGIYASDSYPVSALYAFFIVCWWARRQQDVFAGKLIRQAIT